MPELPEAETIRRDLAKEATGAVIEDAQVYDKRVLGKGSIKDFISRIKGARIADVLRRGKAIVIKLEKKPQPQWLVIQLGMTGLLLYGEGLQKRSGKDIKAAFRLSGGKYLNYSDQRMFGRLFVVRDLDEIPFIKTLGLEPLNGSFDIERVREQLRRRTLPVKSFLMDQRIIAGIGNIYASEILFRARLDPQKRADQLSDKEIRSLHQFIPQVLNEAIERRGTSMRNYRDIGGEKGGFITQLKVYNRKDEPCARCGSAIKRLVQSGRSTFYCEKCQR